MSVTINFDSVVKKYDENTVVKNLSTHVERGELFTLLGPSGCGKTTLLRMVAGFNSIEDGLISFDEEVINHIPAYKRNIGMVFQNYAIFPHMTVSENVAYGLKNRKVSKSEIETRVSDMLKMVQIEEYKDRLPEKLSGGQQQRVALARAIVIHPKVLLMDEPLSNLDAKLRIEMRSAIRDIQKKVGITTIYVTHDQEEALAISDRIAVMKDGIIQQVGTPQEIFMRPQNIFVATFIGHSNILEGTILKDQGKTFIQLASGHQFEMDHLKQITYEGQSVKISMRPNEITMTKEALTGFKGTVVDSIFLGTYINYQIELDNGQMIELTKDFDLKEGIMKQGRVVYLKPVVSKINIYNEEGSENLIDEVMQYDEEIENQK